MHFDETTRKLKVRWNDTTSDVAILGYPRRDADTGLYRFTADALGNIEGYLELPYFTEDGELRILSSDVPSLTPGTLESSSLRFPPENGEDPVSLATSTDGENGMLSLAGSAGSANLVSSTAKWLQSAGALVVVTTVETLQYDGMNRNPYLCGTNIESTTSRFFGLRYVPRVTQTTIGNEHRFGFHARGESAASAAINAYSPQVPSGAGQVLVAMRFDGTDFVVDLWDCDTGTKTAGTPVAKPTGWDGIQNLTLATAIGGVQPDRFPLMASNNTPQTINAWRGELGLFAMLDTNPSDADLEAVALGADPWTTFGSANVRAGLLPEGAGPWPVVSNRPFFASDNWTQHGTLYPGSRLRRQSAATYFTLDKLPDPALVTVAAGQTTGRLPVSFKLGGVSGQVQVRVQDEDGSIVGADWQNVTVASGATASGAVELPFHPNDKAYRLRFRVPDGGGGYLYAEANTDVVVCYGCMNLGQSEMSRAIGDGVDNTSNATSNPLGLTFTGATGGKYIYWTTFRTMNAGAGGGTRPVIRRVRYRPQYAGGGLIAVANRLRQYTTKPLAFIDAAVAGTSAFALLNDDAPSRRWSDMEAALSAVAGRDSAGRISVSAIAMMWEAFWAGTNYKGQVLKPLVTGVESDPYVPASPSVATPQADIDHYLLDGVTLDPRFKMVVMPANRRVLTTSASATVDNDSSMATIRATMRDVSGLSDVLLNGPEIAVHSMEQGAASSITHQDTTRLTGLYPFSRKVADAYAIGLGLLTWQRPVLASAALTGGGASIVVTISGKAGDSLDTEGNCHAAIYGDTPVTVIGQTVSGFEVQDGGSGAWTRDGFTATITGATQITLAKTSGTWAAGTKVRFNPGGPGSYLNNWDTANIATEDAWVKSNPVFGGHEIAGDNTGITAV